MRLVLIDGSYFAGEMLAEIFLLNNPPGSAFWISRTGRVRFPDKFAPQLSKAIYLELFVFAKLNLGFLLALLSDRHDVAARHAVAVFVFA